jgi:histidyl-tRNA synthetase
LDYYTKTTFEVISNKVGSQSALCGGGRYDLLIEELGGKPTPGVGFAAGMERILLACENENSFTLPDPSIDVYLIRIDKGLESTVAEIGSLLRSQKLSVEFDYLNRSTKAQMREANKTECKICVVYRRR